MSTDSNAGGLTASVLEAKWKRNPDSEKRRDPFNLRMRRATSWLARAEHEFNVDEPDYDAAFIFHWIAFNAAYAEDYPESYEIGEREAMRNYFRKIVNMDGSHVIYDSVWEKFSGPIRILLNNQYVFSAFWYSTNRDAEDADWRQEFRDKKAAINNALGVRSVRNTEVILRELFDRLYVLRNQLLHGGATYRGSMNRSQVRDGSAIMTFLVPHFINLMLDNPTSDWGTPRFAAGTKLLPSIK
ncbi:MAG: HEPN domain-containing protein [Chloroflexota bacterium]|nr:HEPN domain-containing protein [Chloroflexota bacterium]MDE2959723.1 HEPN domain-containing protein [Chloroflexota bacterium]